MMIPKSENSSLQSISREVDLAWLAGIIDGEGNIQASVQNKKSGTENRHDYFVPKLRIYNTDIRMIQKVSSIYVAENIVFFYHFSPVSRYKNKKDTWRDQLSIEVSSQGSLKKVLALTLPYLVNKKRYAEIMIECIEWVQSRPYRGRMSRSGCNYCLLDEFKNFIIRLEDERAFYVNPSTTKRKAREVLAW